MVKYNSIDNCNVYCAKNKTLQVSLKYLLTMKFMKKMKDKNYPSSSDASAIYEQFIQKTRRI